MRKFTVTLLVLAMMLIAVVPAFAQDDSGKNIVEVAAEAGTFNTLLAAAEAAGLAETLAAGGPFTVFAPTDDAFAALPEGTVEALLNDIPALTDILLYHVVDGAQYAADVVGMESITTLQGSDIAISINDGMAYANESLIAATDIEASNGVIHVIDAVLLPPSDMMSYGSIVDVAAEAGTFNTLLAAATAAGLAETLASDGPFTIFAPTDDAFAALPEGTVEALLGDIPALTDILLYHVAAGEAYAADVVGLDRVSTLNTLDVTVTVSDDGVFLNDSIQVVTTDIMADNGVIHVIDAVLLPPASVANSGAGNVNFRAAPGTDAEIIGTFPLEARAEILGRNAAGDWVKVYFDGAEGWLSADFVTYDGDISELSYVPGSSSIAEIAASNEAFSTLVAAADAAGLVGTLANDGPFTVFAPTNDAFAALPEGTVEALLGDIPALTDILLYHVVAGEAYAADVVTLDSVTAAQGGEITITANDMGVYLNGDVQVVITDIVASNGIVHVINAVLLPPTM